jgi:predicted ATPase/DNA-binding winged helix-turn-helix (wHTH) protein
MWYKTGNWYGFPQTVAGGGAASLSISFRFLFNFFARVVHGETQMPPAPPSLPMHLDLANECLWCGDQAQTLRPKTFALLRYLVAHAGQLLTKTALLEALWPETIVSEVVLSVCLRELRQALGDDARAPRFIETVYRRGYRFIGHLPIVHSSAPCTASPVPPPLLAGRERELDALHGALTTALEASGPLWIGRGQCLDHYGAGEAYLPVLEALGRVCRGPGGQEVVALLRQQAPTWLVQMPSLVRAADLETMRRHMAGATRDRMLRELAEALDLLTARQPLLLVLEDLHWCDSSTLDLLAVLARRRESARLLLLGTYRLPDALQRGHPLHIMHHELQRHGQCTELPLPLLPEAAVTAYLTTRFPDACLPAGLARLVHQRTEGNPLFMVTVVEDWVRRGWLVQADGGWALRVELAAFASTVPESLRQMLEQQLERLSPMEQRVLEVGSVAGATFSAAAVAAGLGHEVVEVEDWCAGLARRRQWLEACGEQVWSDGTVAGRYRFTHALYQEVAYHRLTAARRVQLHRRIGEREEAGYGPQVRERAAVLAMHFVRGRDFQRAVRYLQYAGENALQRSAHPEALQHLTQGLTLLATLPETPARIHQELDLQVALGQAWSATKSHAAPEVEQTYARARALCAQVGETPQLLPTLWGLWRFYNARLALLTVRELGEQLVQLAERGADPTHCMAAYAALGQTLLGFGDYAAAWKHLEQGIALIDQTTQRTLVLRHGEAPGVRCLGVAATTLWCLGYPAQAVRRSQEALALAQALAHPYSLATAEFQAISLHACRREAPVVQVQADALLTLATAQQFPQWVAHGAFWQGWILTMQGQGAAGLAQMHQGVAAIVATGQRVSQPRYLVLLAEAAGHAGQVAEGLRLLAEAWATLEESKQGQLLAEAYRIQGELLLRQAVPAAAQAEACFQQALAIARRQQAKSWELRAAMSLSRLWQQQGKRTEGRALLAPIYDWFTEGFDTPDLQDAKALLEAWA